MRRSASARSRSRVASACSDLAGGLVDRLFLGLLAVGFRSLLGAALFDLGLESLAFLGRLDLVLLQLRRGVGLLGLGPRLCGLDRGFSLSLLEPALAGEIVVVGQLSGQLLGLAGHLAGESAGGSFVGFGFGHVLCLSSVCRVSETSRYRETPGRGPIGLPAGLTGRTADPLRLAVLVTAPVGAVVSRCPCTDRSSRTWPARG